MATKIQSLPMAVVFKMAGADLMESYRTHDVQVLSIGLCAPQVFEDDDNEQSIIVTATVNSREECFAEDCGTHQWMLTWDEEECRFTISQRWDEDENDNADSMTASEKKVRDIVQEVLDKDNLNDNEVTEVTLDDGGNCIHVTIKGGVEYPTIAAIGREFGDPEPNVYGEGYNLFRLVIINETHDELVC